MDLCTTCKRNPKQENRQTCTTCLQDKRRYAQKKRGKLIEEVSSKTQRHKAHPDQVANHCEFARCSRKKNLWPYEWDGHTIWLCYPHYRVRTRLKPPYKGRYKHNEFAKQFLNGGDYPFSQRTEHHEWAKRQLSGHAYLDYGPGTPGHG